MPIDSFVFLLGHVLREDMPLLKVKTPRNPCVGHYPKAMPFFVPHISPLSPTIKVTFKILELDRGKFPLVHHLILMALNFHRKKASSRPGVPCPILSSSGSPQ
jgi:hypothetical protein